MKSMPDSPTRTKLTPAHLDWVEIRRHAENALSSLPISRGEVIGRLKAEAGIIYRDAAEGKADYNIYFSDKDIVLAFDVRYVSEHTSKTAIVRTAFRCRGPWNRFKQPRFEQFNPE